MIHHPGSPFEPAPGLASPHLQTLYASFFRRGPGVPLRRERWDLPDGDFLDVDRLEGDPAAPHLLILHGLEGSSEAGYVRAILGGAWARGWGAVAMSFRSCGRSGPNLLPRFYHSGETSDALGVIARLREEVAGPIAGVGFSLGGNVVLRLLAEGGERAPLAAGAAISVPLDLWACVRALDGDAPMARLYRGVFLRSLRRKALEKASRYPDRLDAGKIRSARTLEAFDDAVTARLHGFSDARDYYRRCSSGPVLERIRKPTLYLASRDDPFLADSLEGIARDAPAIRWLLTERGGHVGFVGGTILQPSFWAEEEVLRYLDGALA